MARHSECAASRRRRAGSQVLPPHGVPAYMWQGRALASEQRRKVDSPECDARIVSDEARRGRRARP